jgi:hypothetical protein
MIGVKMEVPPHSIVTTVIGKITQTSTLETAQIDCGWYLTITELMEEAIKRDCGRVSPGNTFGMNSDRM